MEKTLVRGIRGATTAKENTRESIVEATRELLQKIAGENHCQVEDIVSIFFSVTPDLNAYFPASAARDLGWNYVPLFGTTEIDVPGSVPRCIRVMAHVNTTKAQRDIKHIYLKEAAQLRPDLLEQI